MCKIPCPKALPVSRESWIGGILFAKHCSPSSPPFKAAKEKRPPVEIHEPRSPVIIGYCSNQAAFERGDELSPGQLIKIKHKRCSPIILDLLKWASFQLLCLAQEPLPLSVQLEPDGKTKPVSGVFKEVSLSPLSLLSLSPKARRLSFSISPSACPAPPYLACTGVP